MAFPLPMLLAAYEALNDTEDEEVSSGFDEFDDESLFSLFHLTRPCLMFIADSIRARMHYVSPKYPNLSVDALVMVTLNYYAHGISSASLLTRLGLTHTHCPAIISLVSGTISGMTEKFVTFPETEEAKATVASNVKTLCGIPDVLGILASPHFRVRVSPYDKEDYRTFFSPLGYTAVVSQLICDSDGNILCVEKCEVGSTSEHEMWASSARGKDVEEGLCGPYWFIAGKGYLQSKHVLTSVTDPASDSEVRFNDAHAKILGIMWATLSCLMRRFKVLLQLGFAKESCLDQKANIIRACCVLHNIAKKFSVPSLPVGSEPVYPGKQHSGTLEVSNEALSAREALINRVFSAPVSASDK
ncbi:putative nuclease HARBI1 [Eucyclogobius newberryi]|uniref:putative nuclease HARBI1 n=1 Tax=Eucyclogobius newberryi TaxID=166745 RepID=UPI003B5B9BC8